MSLYLGSEKVQINSGGAIYALQLSPEASSIVGNVLLSSDNFVLMDANGLVLVTDEDGE